MEEQISNPASERVVLSGIIKHGSEAFIDVDDIIDVSTFTLEQNKIIYWSLISSKKRNCASSTKYCCFEFYFFF